MSLNEMSTGSSGMHLLSRSEGLVDRDILHRSAVVVGAGSVGSYVSELLVRSGVQHLTIIDPESVSKSNICRSSYVESDVDRPKVEALTDRLRQINPQVEVRPVAQQLESMDRGELIDLLARADVVIGAVDSNPANALLCHLAYFSGTPAMHIGVWNKGSGGEVVISVPGHACYLCATAVRHQIDSIVEGIVPETDYGLGRTMAVNALIADIHHVASLGTKLAIGALATGGESPARQLLDRALDRGWTFAVIGSDLDYWAFPMLLDGVAGQLAFQSVWTGVERQADCAVCGDEAMRSDPTVAPSLLSPDRLRQASEAHDGP